MRSDRHDETNSRFSENLRTPLKVDLCFRANNKRDDTVVKYMSYSWGGGLPFRPPVKRIFSFLKFQYMYRTSFIILYSDQQIHNYFTNYHTPTCFDIIVSSSGSLQLIPCQVTQVFQMQLLVIQFTIKMFHTCFHIIL